MRKYALPLALLADVVLVIVFAAIGRGTHQESNAVLGALDTAWPFLVGLAIGWVICLAAKLDPMRAWPSGTVLAVAAVVVGMLLRWATGEGTAVAFIMVATGFNLATLMGWRALAQVTQFAMRRRA